jgi:hypothetical protein
MTMTYLVRFLLTRVLFFYTDIICLTFELLLFLTIDFLINFLMSIVAIW